MNEKFDLIGEQWRLARKIQSILNKRGVTPVFAGYFAKCAITGDVGGSTKDIDTILFDRKKQTTKNALENWELASFIVEELEKRSVRSRSQLTDHAVVLNVSTTAGEVSIELMYPSEWLDPDKDQLTRSRTYNGIQVISPEDWIVMKLEAIRDRTVEDGKKHKGDLIEVANHLKRYNKKLNLEIIQVEIEKREKRKQKDMTNMFQEIFIGIIIQKNTTTNQSKLIKKKSTRGKLPKNL